MEKIINGKRYNTETAALVGCWDNGLKRDDIEWKRDTLYKKRGGEHEQAAADAANFMLDWAEMGANYAINPEMLKNIMRDRFARDIIAYMAPTEAVWFEMLLDGNVELAETPEFKNMAIAVMQNYLARHPEAIVQVLQKYSRDAIPKELMPGNNYATVPMYEIKFNR